MKTILILNHSLSDATMHIAQIMMNHSAQKIGISLTYYNVSDSQENIKYLENEVTQFKDIVSVILLGDIISVDMTHILKAKRFFQGDVSEAIRAPEAFLKNAIANSAPYVFTNHIDNIHASQNAIGSTDKSISKKRIIAVTACPSGVAHTYMAAEAIELEAKKRGWWVKVETRGSVGVGNSITSEEVAQADLVLVAADIEVDLSKFSGKKIYRTSTGLALKKTAETLDNAVRDAQCIDSENKNNQSEAFSSGVKTKKIGAYGHLLTGVSYMLPMVVAGGLCIALSFIFGIEAFKEKGTLAEALMTIGGGSAFALMVPVLAGYIAFSIADRPGLTPGMIGGMLAASTGAGFLGGIIAGFIAGYAAKFISTRLYLPHSMEALKPILIIPLVASLITGLMMIYVVGKPVAGIMQALTVWLQSIGTANAVILGVILGAMMCTDMGGPVNKAAYAFGVGLLSTNIYAPMAAIMAAGMVPPLAMGLATLLARHKFQKNEQEGGKAAIVLGLSFITEGAIPFAARDPMRVLPCCIAGGALTGALSMVFGVQLMAPHGGLFVLLIPGAINPVLGYLIAIASGTILAGVLYALLKRSDTNEQSA